MDTAERFLAAARTTFAELAEHPTLRALLQPKRAELAGRMASISACDR
nr:hypothetical protein [Thiohalocapsa sp.]